MSDNKYICETTGLYLMGYPKNVINHFQKKMWKSWKFIEKTREKYQQTITNDDADRKIVAIGGWREKTLNEYQ